VEESECVAKLMDTNTSPPLFARRRGERIAMIAANTAACLLALAGIAAMAGGLEVMGRRGLFAEATPAGLALLVVLSALVEGARRWGHRQVPRRTLLMITGLVLALTASSFVNHLLGFAPLWQWPDALALATGRPLSAPMEFSSLIVLGLLGGIGALTLSLLKRPRRREALALASLGLACGITSLLARVAGAELVFGPELRAGSPLTAFALTAVCAAIALGCELREFTVWILLGASRVGSVSEEELSRQTRALTVAGLAFAAAVGLTAVYTRIEVSDTEKSVGETIIGVAALKKQDIVHWRVERQGDLRILLRQPVITTLIRGGGGRTDARNLIDEVQQSYGYAAIVVFDADFRTLVSTDETAPVDRTAEWWADLRTNSDREIACDFVDDPQRGVCLDFIGVMRDEAGRILGGVLMRHHASRGLLPDFQRWPVKSETAEVLILRIEGQRLRLLTELRHQRGAAFRLEEAITPESDVLSVQAMFRPPGTILRGVDVRRVPAIGVAHRVPDSNWILVAKMDRTEALVHARDQLEEAGLVIVLLFGVVGISVRLLWRQRQRGLIDWAREAEASRQEMAERFGVLMQRANDAIILFDQEQRVVEANPRATQLYGYAAEEWTSLTASDLRADDARSTRGRRRVKTSPMHSASKASSSKPCTSGKRAKRFPSKSARAPCSLAVSAMCSPSSATSASGACMSGRSSGSTGSIFSRAVSLKSWCKAAPARNCSTRRAHCWCIWAECGSHGWD
jgi:PAS domain-containing protein